MTDGQRCSRLVLRFLVCWVPAQAVLANNVGAPMAECLPTKSAVKIVFPGFITSVFVPIAACPRVTYVGEP